MTLSGCGLWLSKRAVNRTATKKVGKTIRLLREKSGYSQERFAQFAGIERARYGHIERGTLNISLEVLYRIAAHLDVKPSVLLEAVSLDDLLLNIDEVDQIEGRERETGAQGSP